MFHRSPNHCRQTEKPNNCKTITSPSISLDITSIDIQFLRNKGAETRCIQHASHTDYTLTWEMANVECELRHRIERVGHHDNDRVGGIFHDLLGDLCDNFLVLLHQIIAAHTRFAWETGCDHHDIRFGSIS